MPDSAGAELDVLERRGGTRRSGLVLLAVAAVLVVTGVAVWAEGARRAPGEREALDGCAQGAAEAVARAEARLGNRANFVRPVLGTTPRSVEAGLLRSIAREVAPVQPLVAEALTRCRTVDVWLLHDEHRAARDAQVELLAAETERLDAVAADGSAYFTGWEQVRELRADAAAVWP